MKGDLERPRNVIEGNILSLILAEGLLPKCKKLLCSRDPCHERSAIVGSCPAPTVRKESQKLVSLKPTRL